MIRNSFQTSASALRIIFKTLADEKKNMWAFYIWALSTARYHVYTEWSGGLFSTNQKHSEMPFRTLLFKMIFAFLKDFEIFDRWNFFPLLGFSLLLFSARASFFQVCKWFNFSSVLWKRILGRMWFWDRSYFCIFFRHLEKVLMFWGNVLSMNRI